MKNIFNFLFLAAIFTSCEDVEPTLYNGTLEEGTFISFSRTRYALPIERDATGTLNIIVNASSVSSVDRTYNVELIPSTSLSAANPATYSFPGTVTIPAGQYQGVLVVTGQDNDLVTEEVKEFRIRLTGVNDANIDQDIAIVEVFEVCALQDEDQFLGNYMVDQITSNFGPAGTTSIPEGPVVLVEGDTPYERTFVTEPYPGFGLDAFTFVINFKCDFVNMGTNVDTGIGCQGNNIRWQPTANPAAYNTADDSTFDVVFTENVSSSCNTGPREVRLRFTRID